MIEISRSAMVMCVHLVATVSMTASDAIEFVQQRRNVMRSNGACEQQLKVYAFLSYGKEAQARHTRRTALQARLRGFRNMHWHS